MLKNRQEISGLAELDSWFSDYVAAFCRRDPDASPVYRMKEAHTRRVRRGMRRLGAESGLDGRELALAETAGLLHDLGRFGQYERYRTFRDDRSEHHGRTAVRVIAAHGLLSAVPAAERRRLLRAVANHNAARLRPLADPASDLLLKLLRDADKLDILQMAADRIDGRRPGPITDFDVPAGPACSPAALAAVCAGRVVPLATVRSRGDALLFYLSWIFDLNSPAAFRQVLASGWLERLGEAIPHSAGVAEALSAVRAHGRWGSTRPQPGHAV